MRTLVIGGGASGKSAYAESLAIRYGGQRIYIATMKPYGQEAEERISRHQTMRKDKGFVTLECYVNLAEVSLSGSETVLLECLGNLAANELFRSGGTPDNAHRAVCLGLEILEEQCRNLVVVSNDIFRDGCSYTVETEAYIRLLGSINATVAARFEQVCEVVSGVAVWHKGGEM